MTSRERVLAALRHQPVDRVPWMEGIVDDRLASRLCGEPIRVSWDIAPDGTPVASGAELAQMQKKVCRVLGKDNVNWNAFAPVYAGRTHMRGVVIVGEGLIHGRGDFERIQFPDLGAPGFFDSAREFIAHKGEYCAVACIRLGIGAVIMSMGLEAFSYAMADDPQLIVDMLELYGDWTQRSAPILAELGFDLFWAFDDVAFNSGPMFSPDFYRDTVLPAQKRVAAALALPLITHSDGDMNPILDDWLTLGQAAIHPIQPDVMDIERVKAAHGERIALVGNIFMEDLVHRQPAEITAQVRGRIERLGVGGGYIVSSSNSLTADMKDENVLAMRDAIREYGTYG
ncbi:MAG: uroporphyrinogen decarboxylase family protein [Gemmatimonadota bacterium]